MDELANLFAHEIGNKLARDKDETIFRSISRLSNTKLLKVVYRIR